MQVDHEYMARSLAPYLDLAATMDDKLVAYLLGMAVEHCVKVMQKPPKPPVRVQKLNKAAGFH